MSERHYWQQLKQAYRAQQIIWLVSALVFATIVWAAFAQLDEVVVGEGHLVPSVAVQRVQSLDVGILRQLHTREGDVVSKGQLLVTLDETRAKASYAEVLSEQHALKARRERLLLELLSVADNRIVMQTLNLDGSEHFNNESASYLADLNELSGSVSQADENTIQQRRDLAEAIKKQQTLSRSLTLMDEEIRLTKNAVESGALSASELRKLERERVRLSGQQQAGEIALGRLESMVTETEHAKQLVFDTFRARVQAELSETDARLARIKELLTGLNSQLQQTRLYASMAGTVKSINLTSIGGVAKSGETIMEIVPDGTYLLVETKIAPKDIARIQLGQEAIIKLSAYDFVIYGGVKGEVTHISPDALMNERGESYFIVHISGLSEDWNKGVWRSRPLIPGMQAEVDILSGKKTVLQYWLKPLLRARAASMQEP